MRPSITAVVGGLPRSWQTAPSMIATCSARDEIVDARSGLVDHQQRVNPDIALRVPLGLLRASHQRPQLRQERIDHTDVERQRQST